MMVQGDRATDDLHPYQARARLVRVHMKYARFETEANQPLPIHPQRKAEDTISTFSHMKEINFIG